ncbi:MAG: sporulation integral membrane protein YtvI [Eubacteriales bacterium]|nr:sporulation integral membrane protein YtvI [Eubacteriales bacterium]
MSEEPRGRAGGEEIGRRIRRNTLNLGIFSAELLLLVLAGPALARFFMPALAGWVIAQIANPLVRFLEKHLHIVRRHSSVGIIVGVILLIVLGCYYASVWIVREAGALLENFPEYFRTLESSLTQIGENLQAAAAKMSPEMSRQIQELVSGLTSGMGTLAGSLGGVTVGAAGNAAKNIPSMLVSFLFILLFSYFFIAQQDRIHKAVSEIIPHETKEQMKLVWDRMKYAVVGYFRAQFKIMFVVFAILLAGFLFLRIGYAFFLALLVSFLDFLPMLGTGTVLIPWAVYLLLCGRVPLAAALLVLYAVTQVTRQLIQPKMVGDSIGMDTLTTLLFLFIGWRAAGLVGMIVAVPVGLIVLKLYEAGAFDHVIRSAKELRQDIHTLRRGPD